VSVDPQWLKEIIEDDESGLLKLPVKVAPATSRDRLVTAFKEICAFIEKHRRPPKANPADMAEFKLYHRLQAIIDDPAQRAELAEYDTYGVLVEPEPPATLDEIFASDELGVLEQSPAVEIFTLRNVPAEKASPDEVAERQPCPDFERFEPLFAQCHADLKEGTRKLIEFRNESQISAESFYVVRGVLAYVAEIGEETKVRGRRVARLRCIFENGTESNLLLQSLARSLYDNGRRVTEPNAETLARMGLEVDTPVGVIYVLRSLSTDPQVTGISNLHKIGFTKGTTQNRVADASRVTTYLNAAVEVVAEYGVPAVIASGVEATLHRFFASARLDVTYERGGETTTTADEWFSVPLPVIDEAIGLLEAGTITNYEYDSSSRVIRLRQN
jgi:hypothetical protein